MRLIAMVAGVSLMAAQARALSQPVVVATHGEVPDAEPPASGTLTVPAGTLVALTLVSMIKSKSTPVGGTVRAQVAFPISVGDHVAIPVGTFVEGQLVQAKSNVKAKKHQPKPQDLIVHFTRLVFANGYTVGLDATNTAEVTVPDLGLPRGDTGGVEVAALEYPALGLPGGGEAMLQQTGYPFPPFPPLPTLPPLQSHGPNPAVLAGAIAGGFLLLGTGLYFLARGNHGSTDELLRDAGWQFEISLGSPLVLDAAQVQAALTADAVPAN
jgi:type IV secretion system protein VirB10